MTEEINYRQTRSSTRNGSLGLIFVLLLLALLVFSFWYQRDDGRTYGDAALLEAQDFKSKALQKMHALYDCAIHGCANKAPLLSDNAEVVNHTKMQESQNTPPPTQDSIVVPSQPIILSTTERQKPTAPLPPSIPSPGMMTNPAAPGVDVLPGASSATQALAASAQPVHPAQLPTPLAVPFSAVSPNAQVMALPIMPTNPTEQSTQTYSALPSQPAPPVGVYQQQPRLPLLPRSDDDSQRQQTHSILLAARQLTVEGHYQEAVSLYRKQLSKNPNDVDAYGELGNVLWLTRHYAAAAQNYYEASTRLLDRGLPEAARPLLPIVERFEPVLGNLLRQKSAQIDY